MELPYNRSSRGSTCHIISTDTPTTTTLLGPLARKAAYHPTQRNQLTRPEVSAIKPSERPHETPWSSPAKPRALHSQNYLSRLSSHKSTTRILNRPSDPKTVLIGWHHAILFQVPISLFSISRLIVFQRT